MTTFVDREHAIEAHYALLELAAFRDRLHRYKGLGYSLAARLDLHGTDADRLAIDVARRCVSDPIDVNVCSRLAAEMSRHGLDLSLADIRGILRSDDGEPSPIVRASLPLRQPWTEFVMTQLLLLFGSDRAG